MSDYILIWQCPDESISDFRFRVNVCLKKGYECLGAPFIKNNFLIQAMIKK